MGKRREVSALVEHGVSANGGRTMTGKNVRSRGGRTPGLEVRLEERLDGSGGPAATKVAKVELQLEPGKNAHRTSFSADGAKALVCSLQSNEFWVFDVSTGRRLSTFERHPNDGALAGVNDVKWSADESRILSGGNDGIVRVWDAASAHCTAELKMGTPVYSVAWWSNDGFVVAGLYSGGIEVWGVEGRQRARELKGHTDTVYNLEASPNQTLLLSASTDKTARLWNLHSGECVHILQGHAGVVYSAIFSRDGQRALSGSEDGGLRLWDLATGHCVRVLEGHTDAVRMVTWHPSHPSVAVSGADDQTIHLWNVDSGACLGVLKGHQSPVRCFRWSYHERRLTSCDYDGVVISWDLSSIFMESIAVLHQVQYTNAKVLLVGDSGAGKTGLSMRLAKDEWGKSDSTVGAWSTRWSLRSAVHTTGAGEREIWLWDFGGQHDQRLVHQLFMDETALVVLVFDGQREGFLDAIRQWDRDIARAARGGCRKLLVAGRVDVGAPRMRREDLEAFAKDAGFAGYFETSAKTGFGCDELKAAIAREIDWEKIPWRSSPIIFKLLKDAIIALKDAAISKIVGNNKVSGDVLLRFDELRDKLRARLGEAQFADEQLKAVLSLLAGPGVVWELKFGGYYLLHPELVSSYAQGLLQTEPLQLGFARESDVFAGVLAPTVMRLNVATKDRLLLLELHRMLLERALCYREITPDKGPILIFPNCFKAARPAAPFEFPVTVSYTFTGFVDETYATLVVRLHHAEKFGRSTLWQNFAEFGEGQNRLGLVVVHQSQSTEFRVCRSGSVPVQDLIDFCEFVHKHLLEHRHDVVRLRHFVCANCNYPVEGRTAVKTRIERYLADRRSGDSASGPETPSVECNLCEKRVPVWDEVEEHFASADFESRVTALQLHSKRRLEQQAANRVLIADIISIVLQAGQQVQELLVPSIGAHMVSVVADGAAQSEQVLIVLGSKDGLRRGATQLFFQSDVLRYTPEWLKSRSPVVLVLHDDEGTAQWMDVSNVRVTDGRIPFDGQILNVAAVRSWAALAAALGRARPVVTLAPAVKHRRSDPVLPPPESPASTADRSPFEWRWTEKRFDVFLSFRGNEPFSVGVPSDAIVSPEQTMREHLVRPLAADLRKQFSVFFDERSLKDAVADAPGSTIDDILQGLLSTRGGGVAAVLITRTYLERKWTLIELAACVALHKAEQVRLLVLVLDTSVDDVCAHPFVVEHCPALTKVPIRTLPLGMRSDPLAVRTWISEQVRQAYGNVALAITGDNSQACFHRLLNAICARLDRDASAQASLALAMHIPFKLGELSQHILLRVPHLSSINVAPLLEALERDFETTQYRDLIDLVRRYESKWLGDWTKRAPTVDLVDLKRVVEDWMEKSTGKRART